MEYLWKIFGDAFIYDNFKHSQWKASQYPFSCSFNHGFHNSLIVLTLKYNQDSPIHLRVGIYMLHGVVYSATCTVVYLHVPGCGI